MWWYRYKLPGARTHTHTHAHATIFLRTYNFCSRPLDCCWSVSPHTLTLLCSSHWHPQLHHSPAKTVAPPCNPESVPTVPRMSFYGVMVSGEPSKPRMSAHTGSSTGAIRPIPSKFRVLRRQSPLTAWSRRMSCMLAPNPLHHRPFLPVSRLAPDGR
jgi:hypothetical protein